MLVISVSVKTSAISQRGAWRIGTRSVRGIQRREHEKEENDDTDQAEEEEDEPDEPFTQSLA